MNLTNFRLSYAQLSLDNTLEFFMPQLTAVRKTNLLHLKNTKEVSSAKKSSHPLTNLISSVASMSNASLPSYTQIDNSEHKKLLHIFTQVMCGLVDAKNGSQYIPLGLIATEQNKDKLNTMYKGLKAVVSSIIDKAISKSSDKELMHLLLSVRRFMVECSASSKSKGTKAKLNIDVFSMLSSHKKRDIAFQFWDDSLSNFSEKDIRKFDRSQQIEFIKELAYSRTFILFLRKEKGNLPNKFFPELLLHIYDLAILAESKMSDDKQEILCIRKKSEIDKLLAQFDGKFLKKPAKYDYYSHENGDTEMERDANYIDDVIDKVNAIMDIKDVATTTKELLTDITAKLVKVASIKNIDIITKKELIDIIGKINKAQSLNDNAKTKSALTNIISEINSKISSGKINTKVKDLLTSDTMQKLNFLISFNGVSNLTKEFLTDSISSKLFEYIKLRLASITQDTQIGLQVDELQKQSKDDFIGSLEKLIKLYIDISTNKSQQNADDFDAMGDQYDWDKCNQSHFTKLQARHNAFLTKEDEFPDIKNLTLLQKSDIPPKTISSSKAQTWLV
ncbi:MAG: hypothetical protein RLZZ210_1230 [Pseudomonadota bacterium]|jgi:hypothetical protein